MKRAVGIAASLFASQSVVLDVLAGGQLAAKKAVGVLRRKRGSVWQCIIVETASAANNRQATSLPPSLAPCAYPWCRKPHLGLSTTTGAHWGGRGLAAPPHKPCSHMKQSRS